MSVDIRIDFENPNAVFYAGESLRGTVQLTLREQKNVRGVYIRIYGKAHCEWSEGSGRNETTYSDEELYLDETTYLVGNRDDVEFQLSSNVNVELMPGTNYQYNFQCNLPNNLPTSVEGDDVGYIRYTARVTVDVPMGLDIEVKKRFTVIHPLNLNDIPHIKKPVTVARSEMGCCSVFCCMTPIEVSAQIPVQGYTSGQVINLQLHVTHTGSPKNYEFSVKLMKRLDYYADDVDLCCSTEKAHCDEKQCITKKDASCRISNTTSVEIVRLDLQVPPVPPTDTNSSRIVKVTYFLKIKTSSSINESSKNIIPILIGTYPIEDYTAPNSNATPTAPITDQPTAPLLDSPSGNSVDKELPTYEEAMVMTVGAGGGSGGAKGGDSFRPRYPVFKRATSYSSGN